MKKPWHPSFFPVFSFLLVLTFCVPSSHAAGTGLNCVPLTGRAPIIDGTISAGEWPGPPQLTIPSPIQTNIYCRNDAQNLYVLVNALGDTTDDFIDGANGPCSAAYLNRCDECLLVFADPGQPTAYMAEVWGTSENIVGTNDHFPANAEVAIGFSDHRFYEWKIPLSSINAVPGQTFDFSSPRLCKFPGFEENCLAPASIPFDGATRFDNEWPAGVILNDRTTWGTITLGQRTIGVPALNEWGIIVSMVLAGLVAVIFLRKRKSTH
jgi:hypothetical protein